MCNCGVYCPHCGQRKPVIAPSPTYWPGQYTPWYVGSPPPWQPPVTVTFSTNTAVTPEI